MKEKYKNLLNDTVIFAMGSLGSKVILFFLLPLYTNYLSTEEYGTADLITTLVTLIFPLVSLSIDLGVIRFGMKSNEKKEDILVNSIVVLLFSFVVMLLLIPIFNFYRVVAEWKLYLVVLIALSNITEIEKVYLKVKNKNKAYSLIGILQTLILAGSNIVLLTFLNTGVKGYLLSNIAALSVCAIASFFAADLHKDLRKGKYNFVLLKRMVVYSAPLVFSRISWWLMHSFDKVLIEWMIGASALGLYTAATKIPSLVNVVTGVFNQAWSISSIRESETTKDTNFYSKMFDYNSFVMFGVGIVIISVVKPLMSVYVGEAFRDSWVYVPLLLVSAICYSMFAFCGTLYVALQKSVNDMWTSVFAAIMNIIVNYVFIIKIGVWGAIIGSVASLLLFTIVRIIDIKRYIEFKIDIIRFIVNVILVLLLSLSVTINFYPIIVSIISILLYIVINKKLVVFFGGIVIRRFRKKGRSC